MSKRRETSVIILITLAELAWLAAFGLLFAYRGKVGELSTAQREVTRATNELVFFRTNAPEAAILLDELIAAKAGATNLQSRLANHDTITKELESQLQSTSNVLAELQRKWKGLPPNVSELASGLQSAMNELGELRLKWTNAGAQILSYSNKAIQFEVGEVAIRRELIGLPTNELHRVVFIVDTSSSMRRSPAWKDARGLMRTWLEYLSVEECALIQFNDKARAFPHTGYLRVREPGGHSLSEAKAALLSEFDNTYPGTYSDLLAALKLAYKLPKADLIVLFTDGHPHVAGSTDSSYAGKILGDVGSYQDIPILAVAVGSYEVEEAGGPREKRNRAIAFLKQLANRTGGNFIGR